MSTSIEEGDCHRKRNNKSAKTKILEAQDASMGYFL